MAKYNIDIDTCGLPTILLVTFIVLKLTNVIDWSWWWVLSPIWIPLLIVLGVIGLILLIMLIASLISIKI